MFSSHSTSGPIDSPNTGEPVALVAGWGDYPLVVARALHAQGKRVCALGIKNHADRAALEPYCHAYKEVGLGRLGTALRYFHGHGCLRGTMAGKIFKTVILRPGYVIRNLPDWRTLRTFYNHLIVGKADRRDDTILGALVAAFAEDGIELIPATDFVPEILVKDGILVGSLSRAAMADIEFGWRMAKEIGRLDIGQCVVVKGQLILAVEAIEGTDECIRRAGALCPAGGFVVVKVAKPQQDMRFDVPTIGEGTIRTMIEAGGKVLAVEAGRTILLHEAETLALAKRHGISVVALERPEVLNREAAA